MKTDFVELTPITGQTDIGSHKLFHRNLLVVERSGANFKIRKSLISTPGNGDVVYISIGVLRFNTPFNDGETVKAWYKL